jgi:hypothetical protein
LFVCGSARIEGFMEAERRHYVRRAPTAHPLFVFFRQASRLATVRDISQDGLKAQYTPPAAGSPDWTRIDIFVKNVRRPVFFSVPCRVVYDLPQLSENESFTGGPSRVIGLHFQDLSDKQRLRLNSLLAYTSPVD